MAVDESVLPVTTETLSRFGTEQVAYFPATAESHKGIAVGVRRGADGALLGGFVAMYSPEATMIGELDEAQLRTLANRLIDRADFIAEETTGRPPRRRRVSRRQAKRSGVQP